MKAELQSLLDDIRNDLGDDFLAMNIVGLDGMSIAGMKARSEFNSEAVSAHFAMVMKLGGKLADGSRMGKLRENQLNTNKAMIFSRLLGDGNFYWLLATTRNATLGIVRGLMDEYEMRLWGAIPS